MHSFIPLFIGGMIYFFARPNSIYFLDWINTFVSIESKIELPNWIQYNLPGGLWTFAFTNFILIIWDYEVSKKSIIWVFTPLIIGVISETVFGTFDLIDLLFIVIGATLPIAKNIKNQNSYSLKTINYANKN